MKRSEVNAALREMEAMCRKHCCYLPPYRLLCNEYPQAR